jgi:hypothetical protein
MYVAAPKLARFTNSTYITFIDAMIDFDDSPIMNLITYLATEVSRRFTQRIETYGFLSQLELLSFPQIFQDSLLNTLPDYQLDNPLVVDSSRDFAQGDDRSHSNIVTDRISIDLSFDEFGIMGERPGI